MSICSSFCIWQEQPFLPGAPNPPTSFLHLSSLSCSFGETLWTFCFAGFSPAFVRLSPLNDQRPFPRKDHHPNREALTGNRASGGKFAWTQKGQIGEWLRMTGGSTIPSLARLGLSSWWWVSSLLSSGKRLAPLHVSMTLGFSAWANWEFGKHMMDSKSLRRSKWNETLL